MIQVHVSEGSLNSMHHEILIGEKIVKSLKAAGIPAEGVFTVRGVKHGELTYVKEGSVHQFRWRENADDNSTVGFIRSNLPDGTEVYKNGQHAEDDEL